MKFNKLMWHERLAKFNLHPMSVYSCGIGCFKIQNIEFVKRHEGNMPGQITVWLRVVGGEAYDEYNNKYYQSYTPFAITMSLRRFFSNFKEV